MSFYRCGPVHADPAAAQAGTARRRVNCRTIDIHCHMSVPEAFEVVRQQFDPALEPSTRFTTPESAEVNRALGQGIHAQLTSAEQKLSDMDRLGIDIQVLSPAPPQYHYWADPELTAASARIINDRIAGTVDRYPDRFSGLGTLPMQNSDLAVREMRRCIQELGLRGVEISTNIAGRELSDPSLGHFFAAAEELGILIFLHPLGFTHGERLRQHYLNNVVGNPLESTIALSHLIFGGVLDRHPGLKLCVAHGGGYLASYAGRMDHAHAVRPDCKGCQHPPSTYLKRLYFDTVVFDPDQLASLVSRFGADHILLGSDYPFDMGDADPVGFVLGNPALTQLDKEKILGRNAELLLGLAAAQGEVHADRNLQRSL